jgi:hypothetical protein
MRYLVLSMCDCVQEPKQRIHYTENLSKALDFFQKEEKIK